MLLILVYMKIFQIHRFLPKSKSFKECRDCFSISLPSPLSFVNLLYYVRTPFKMAFRIVVQEGIGGGIKGPKIEQIIEIRGDGTSDAVVSRSTLKPNKHDDYDTLEGSLSNEDAKNLVAHLKERLRGLPTEETIGGEDIYGMNTMVMIGTEDFSWQNGGPGGCVQEPSTNVSTLDVEQKERFKDIVSRIVSIGKEKSLNPSTV